MQLQVRRVEKIGFRAIGRQNNDTERRVSRKDRKEKLARREKHTFQMESQFCQAEIKVQIFLNILDLTNLHIKFNPLAILDTGSYLDKRLRKK